MHAFFTGPSRRRTLIMIFVNLLQSHYEYYILLDHGRDVLEPVATDISGRHLSFHDDDLRLVVYHDNTR